MNLRSGYNASKSMPDPNILTLSMNEIKPLLCQDSHGDAYACIDCTSGCSYGKRAVDLLEKETKGAMKLMSKKEICDASRRVEAMSNYLDVMSQPDPVSYVKTKYNMTGDKAAKNKIYQWQHNYGTNLGMIANRIKEIESEIAASKASHEEDVTETKKPEIVSKNPEKSQEELKPTKRQEEKISQGHLEKMRANYEAEYLSLEQQIEAHKKGIAECEKRIEDIVEKVKSIRAVLDIYNEINAKYV